MIHRCQFCGWDNPHNATVCEKCKTPLQPLDDDSRYAPPVVNEQAAGSRVTERRSSDFNPKSTIRENGELAAKAASCPRCGYPLENGTCASCGFDTSTLPTDGNARKTVRPDRKKHLPQAKQKLRLTPLHTDGTESGEVIRLETEGCISVNREMVAPNNNTITSKEQAVFECKDGTWFITDCSELQTTFVRASRPVKLHDGDVILLGDQMFRFYSD